MKKIISILATLIMCLTLSSCLATTAMQHESGYYDNDVDVNVLISYGVPHYNSNGMLMYFVYRDMYYYPYYSGGVYSFHRFTRILPMDRLGTYRPIPRDFYRKTPSYVHHDRVGIRHHKPNIQHKPNNRNVNGNKPNLPHRKGTSVGANRGGRTRR